MNIKKPKFWDKKKPNLIAYLLFPIAIFVNIIKSLIQKSKKKKFNIKTICVGNFYLGGTGKTSLSIKINKLLNQRNIKSCFIKKFYKNQVDEQKLLENNGKLFLSSDRSNAVKQAENQNYDIAIFDDGLQDETIDYDLRFVCFNNINWIGNGMTIPAGPLRENINNIKNYDHLFLNGNLENIDDLTKEINKINSSINIHLGKYEPINLNEFDINKNYLVFSGIGNHQTFISTVKQNGLRVVKDIEFSDHYAYTKKDIEKILNEANYLNCGIITTEKDFQRLNDFNISRIKVLKVDLKIIDENKLLKSII
ncbi:tetraacyldisaccharide 4'-kinase [Candidatus Pelagibacter sp.]|nr:tetraacyldisaccharide 4'-kinase [Candidatus Pelagibacter sp.]